MRIKVKRDIGALVMRRELGIMPKWRVGCSWVPVAVLVA